MPRVERRSLTFKNEVIQAKVRYGIASKLNSAKACGNGISKAALFLGRLALSVFTLPLHRKFMPLKYYSFSLVRGLQLFTGGLVLPIHKKAGSYLIVDAAVHMAWYDTFKRKALLMLS